jgi:hypothetical protein
MRRCVVRKFYLLGAFIGLVWGAGHATVLDSWGDGENINVDRNITAVADGDNSSWDGKFTISADVTITNILGDGAELNINVTTDDVYITPTSYTVSFIGTATNEIIGDGGHLIFYAGENSVINVNLEYSLFFSGSNWADAGTYYGAYNTDLFVTFSGPGKTNFRMYDDQEVGFEGLWSNDDLSLFYDDFTKTGSGTKVSITMDQGYEDAVINGFNKVVFSRRFYKDLTGDSKKTKVTIGRDSYLAYVSDRDTGIVGSDSLWTTSDYAAVAFDVSNCGSGRMILHTKGTYTVNSDETTTGDADKYNDGALSIFGSYVADLEDPDNIEAVDFKTRAGIECLFRIIDDVAYSSTESLNGAVTYAAELTSAAAAGRTPTFESTAAGTPIRRGLLVINENKSLARFSADPYGDNDWYDFDMYDRGSYTVDGVLKKGNYNTQPGMVLGVNGHMEIFHNTFLDYVAASTVRYAPEDIGNVSVIKKHNPSALCVDGFDWGTSQDTLYTATRDVYGGRHAVITLRGDAATLLYSGVPTSEYLDWMDKSAELVYSFTAGTGTYNGDIISGVTITSGEGNHVLDVEGKLTVRSTADINSSNDYGFIYTTGYGTSSSPEGQFKRHDPVGATATAQGMIHLPPFKVDPAGREVLLDEWLASNANLITHPLTKSSVTYPCHNSSSILLNADLVLDGVRFEHDDALKTVLPSESEAEPSIVGGEKCVFNTQATKDLPKIELYGSKIYCHESLASAGVRFVVTDMRDLTDSNTVALDNTSEIYCYNHGDILDTLQRGYGRVFQIGTQQNLLADGTTSSLLRGGQVNIFRTWDDNASNVDVKLELETALQPKYVGPYFASTYETSVHDLENIASTRQKATQVVYLTNESNMTIGWTTTFADEPIDSSVIDINADDGGDFIGANEYNRYYPWKGIGTDSLITTATNTFFGIPDAAITSTPAYSRAELKIEGDYFYFGGVDSSGNAPAEPVRAIPVLANPCVDRQSGIIYVDHGGKVTIADDKDCYIDTVMATKVWPQVLTTTNTWSQVLAGKVIIPHDQTKFGRSTQPYGLDFAQMYVVDGQTKDHNVRVSSYYALNDPAVSRTSAAGEEISIAWNYRTDNTITPSFTPLRSFDVPDVFGLVRSTPDPSELILWDNVLGEMVYDNWITVSAGDYITQMRVAGATQADPFHLYVTGDPDTYGYVREITSLASTTSTIFGEGNNAVIMLDNSGHLGLGNRDWNSHSENAWNILGQDYVTLVPNGNGFIFVNSNLIIADKWAIIATNSFGKVASGDQRLTFFSDECREIRVPMGAELDLSTFDGGSADYAQKIEFAGKVKLVIESGASIRFPASPDFYPVMYFNDESELIFEEHSHRDEETWTTYDGTEAVRSKILGRGQIWLNKYAKMKINGYSFVGIQSDDTTVTTSITLSVARQGELTLGDENVAGGTLQVGNPVAISSGEVHFTLATQDPRALVKINRDGFFGLGAGLRNKYDEINGNWTLHRLYDVKNVDLNIKKGIFDHSKIFDGDDTQASLMAIGPIDGTYTMSLGKRDEAIIRGGGNLAYITTLYAADDAQTVNITNTATALDGNTDDFGRYSILASDPVIRQIEDISGSSADTITVVKQSASAYPDTTYPNIFDSTSEADFFNYLRYITFPDISPAKYVCLGTSKFKEYIGYVVGTTITRSSNFTAIDRDGNSIDPAEGLHYGALGATGRTQPERYVVLK